ncbi:MAG: error-prone DNA polymerase [Chromatiaceae bacterium]|nr:error-prone DNA polymerase [Chromatiaceae bacterium]
MSAIEYAELHCRTNFSFLSAASDPEALVRRAHDLGYRALAITDECSLAGVVRAHAEAKCCGLPLIIGSEICLADGLRLVLLATSREGYGDLSQLITLGRRRAGKGRYRLERGDLEQGLADCLAMLLPGPEPDLSQAEWLQSRFPGRAWIGVELHRTGADRARLVLLQSLASAVGLPLVAAGGVLMRDPGQQPLLDAMTAIRLGKTLAEAGLALQSNSEHHLRSRPRLARFYPQALLQETLRLAGQCRFSLDELRYEYPSELVPAGSSAAVQLRCLTEAGMTQRWSGQVPQRVRDLVEYELALIAELAYEPYFLTVHDIVRFARSRNILCQGRGSAANSAVCYCLGITEVDPARMEMLFERFISKERGEPPDIDVDFEHQRREEVIQYIYEKYGRERAALAATVISYRPKSAIRDLGKALGLDPDQIDRLASNLSWWDGQEALPERVREAGFDPDNPAIRQLLALTAQLQHMPRHLSQHVGGFVISRGPLSRLVPIENAAMQGRSVIQWDKDDLQTLGLLKVDCLALGMLSAIRRAFDLINGWRGAEPPLGMQQVPAGDAAVYAMIQRAETTGVFQIESRAQMAMLPRLKPACFYDLVIEVAIVRPGPIQGDMVHPYLRRRQGLEPVVYPSPEVEEVLGRTLGVPIFQEQVIKVAMVAAGFSPGEADRLRRSIAAWRRRGTLQQFESRLVEGMVARGYEESFARRIYQQILGFGEYGFPESHAASFALLVYVSAWLKWHHPAAFFAALLNSQPMGFYAPAQLIQEARRQGVTVAPVDVRRSEWECTLEAAAGSPEPQLRLGLRMIKGLPRAGVERLMKARAEADFLTVQDLARRASLSKGDLQRLAAAGALAGLAGNRHQAAWLVMGMEPALPLIGTVVEEAVPALPLPTEGENIRADYANLGLTLERHPLALLRFQLGQRRVVTAAEVRARRHGQLIRTAGIVIGRQRPASANSVTFVTLEDETGQVNLVVWRQLAERQRSVLLKAQLLGVSGEVQREGEVLHVIARRLWDYSFLLGRLLTRSRDFH